MQSFIYEVATKATNVGCYEQRCDGEEELEYELDAHDDDGRAFIVKR